MITVTWANNSVLQIQTQSTFTSVVSVDIVASPNTSTPYGLDIDKERLWVYPNFLPKSTFSTAQDTTNYAYELAPGRSVKATVGCVSTANDSNGISANGVMTLTFASASSGIKGTPATSSWVSMTSGQWYTARMRITGNAGNTHQSLLFIFSNDALSIGGHVDIGAYVLFGTPSTWTWLETPIYSNETGKGFPQFQFKAGNAGTIYVDEIQIINAAPTLVDANRYITRIKYPYGDFDTGGDTTGWGRQIYTGAGSAPTFDVANGELVLNFAGATTSTGQKGLKWTANNGAAGTLYTPNNIQGREVGLRASLTKESGNFNTLSAIVLLGVYGVETNGQQTIGQTPSDLIASAEYQKNDMAMWNIGYRKAFGRRRNNGLVLPLIYATN